MAAGTTDRCRQEAGGRGGTSSAEGQGHQAQRRKRELAGLDFEEQQRALAPDEGGAGGGQGMERGLLDPPCALPFREEMERAFSQDFGDVEAHAGPNARQACAELGSQAYTLGNHIVFASASPPRPVVAHELAHVLQQGGGGGVSEGEGGGSGGSSLEGEADQAAEDAVAGRAPAVGGQAPIRVQAWGGKEHKRVGNKAYAQVAKSKSAAKLGKLMAPASKAVSVKKRKGGISYGEANRQAGDRYWTVEQLAKQGKKRKGTDPSGKRTPHVGFLAEKEWQAHHIKALKAARRSYQARRKPAKRKQAFREAVRLEAFGAHFLEDAFAAGHKNLLETTWLAQAKGRQKLGETDYHEWFNHDGLQVQSGKEEFQSRGDSKLGAKKNKENRGVLETAVKRSLQQVVDVAAGHLTFKAAKQRMQKKIGGLIPDIDIDGYERTSADDADWQQAAAVEMMAADYQLHYDRAVQAGPRTSQSGEVTVDGSDLAKDPTDRDIFDGEFAGKHGRAAARARIVRDLQFLERTLRPRTFGGSESKRYQFASELLHTLSVRLRQCCALYPAGQAPAWTELLAGKLATEWPVLLADLANRRGAWSKDVAAARAAVQASEKTG